MRVEPIALDGFVIYDAPKLDAILVMTQDYSVGQGRLLVECYGAAWATYWGAMGDNNVRSFVAQCSTDYVANRLWPPGKRRLKKDAAYTYLTRIVEAVQSALSSQAIKEAAPK